MSHGRRRNVGVYKSLNVLYFYSSFCTEKGARKVKWYMRERRALPPVPTFKFSHKYHFDKVLGLFFSDSCSREINTIALERLDLRIYPLKCTYITRDMHNTFNQSSAFNSGLWRRAVLNLWNTIGLIIAATTIFCAVFAHYF